VRKKHPEHVNLERWLVSYADFITLLFAFFVIMYAISQADVSKFKAVSASLKSAFEPAGPSSMMSLS
jgi:chemotaxis protein MotB